MIRLCLDHWNAWDLSGGWTRTHLRGAWPWAIWVDPSDEASPRPGQFYWVKPAVGPSALSDLLALAADDRAHFWVTDASLSWVYQPYDGGADIYAPTPAIRDRLKATHADWLSSHPRGL